MSVTLLLIVVGAALTGVLLALAFHTPSRLFIIDQYWRYTGRVSVVETYAMSSEDIEDGNG